MTTVVGTLAVLRLPHDLPHHPGLARYADVTRAPGVFFPTVLSDTPHRGMVAP